MCVEREVLTEHTCRIFYEGGEARPCILFGDPGNPGNPEVHETHSLRL